MDADESDLFLDGQRDSRRVGQAAGRDQRRVDSVPGERVGARENAPRPLPVKEAPSQFQRFVEEATGRQLPIYGSRLFEQPQAYMADSNAPVPADHVLGPGDEVRVQIWGGVNYEGVLRIDRSGQINIPRAGVVTLAGVPVRELPATLRRHLSRNYTNFDVNASLDRLRGIQVYVVGQARQPGAYTLSSLSTLVNALFASGGPSVNGSMRAIQLKRKNKVISTVDLYDFIGRGDKRGDVSLQPGDVIVIPPAGPRVAVVGALDQAAIYELRPNSDGESTVADILGLGGGLPVLATSSKALIERIVSDQRLPRKVQDITLDAEGMRYPLRDGDIVTLLGISPAFANAVTLQGNVAHPLRYRWFEGMRVRDLIPERDALLTPDYYQRKNLLVQNAEYLEQQGKEKDSQGITSRVRGIVDHINWDYAVVERLDRDSLRTVLLPFNLGGAVLQNDESQNLLLKPGDVVTILSQKDLQLPIERQTRLIRVEGEVAAPGVYESLPGETLQQLLRRVGGLTPHAYVYGTEVDRVSVRRKQQENLDLLIRRLEAQQQSQILFMMANRSGSSVDATAQAALMQQQQQLGQAQISALRKLQSKGRIALELDPKRNGIEAYPELPLEDGDRIVVPSVPGFVTAVGAVNNENVFIYRPGRTAGEVALIAGLREEADIDQMFVLRADGSIVARRDRSGFFGSNFDSLALMPGDTLVVPEKLDRETTRNFVMRQIKDVTQILSQFGLGVAAIKAINNL